MKFLRGEGIARHMGVDFGKVVSCSIHQAEFRPIDFRQIEVKGGTMSIGDAIFSDEFIEWMRQAIDSSITRKKKQNKFLAEKALCIINESLLPGERDIVITGQEKKKAKWKRKAGKMKRKRGEI